MYYVKTEPIKTFPKGPLDYAQLAAACTSRHPLPPSPSLSLSLLSAENKASALQFLPQVWESFVTHDEAERKEKILELLTLLSTLCPLSLPRPLAPTSLGPLCPLWLR